MPKPLVELVAALIVIALSVAGFLEAQEYSGPSGYLPKGVTALAILLSAIWALQSVMALRKGEGAASPEKTINWPKFAFFTGLSLAYVIIIPLIGFFTSTLLFVPSVMLALGYRNKSILVAAPVIFVVVLYLLFGVILQVQLPDELLLQLGGAN
ncbi:tripartite tricarboxylate transporter TctB family protein [Marinobacter sp.]|uniref:tripartite tricarboxylate transporter TctB family protein n=1 Tax=Marinobacter sp. TaxID=50741 RepID=UPI00384CF833